MLERKLKMILMKYKKKQKLTKTQKERIYNHLIANALNKKEEYKYHNYDDLDYFGIKDIGIYLLISMIVITTKLY